MFDFGTSVLFLTLLYTKKIKNQGVLIKKSNGCSLFKLIEYDDKDRGENISAKTARAQTAGTTAKRILFT